VTAALDRLKESEPSLSYTHVSGSVAYTQEQYEGSMHMIYEGGLLAVVVVFFFLRDWRATLIAATALPLSILPAFAAMSWIGYSLNIITRARRRGWYPRRRCHCRDRKHRASRSNGQAY
jgi:multidrug efflux pump subunit AcrB